VHPVEQPLCLGFIISSYIDWESWETKLLKYSLSRVLQIVLNEQYRPTVFHRLINAWKTITFLIYSKIDAYNIILTFISQCCRDEMFSSGFHHNAYLASG